MRPQTPYAPACCTRCSAAISMRPAVRMRLRNMRPLYAWCQRFRRRAERAQVLAAFGEALIGQGRHRESRELCEEAIRIAQEVGALAQEGDARKALGVDLAFLGDLEAGVQELTEARRIAEVVGRVDEVARCYAMLSGLLETLGALDAAATGRVRGC